MILNSSIFFGIVGACLGGPVGAVMGAILGEHIDKSSNNENTNSNNVSVNCPHCKSNLFLPGFGNFKCCNCNQYFSFNNGYINKVDVVNCPHCNKEYINLEYGNYNCSCGNKFVYKDQSIKNKTEEYNKDEMHSIFYTAMFSMLGKMAKADGVVTKQEIKVVDEFIKECLFMNDENRKFAIKVFNEAKDSNYKFEDYAIQFKEIFKNKNEMIVDMYDLLYAVAASDGYIHECELDLLNIASKIFSISKNEIEIVKSRHSVKINNNISEYYKVLELNPNDSVEKIKSKYRQLVKDFHPDNVMEKGLPSHFTEYANHRFKQIQDAYEQIRKHRKF